MGSGRSTISQGLACSAVLLFASIWLILHRHQPANRTNDVIVVVMLVTAITGFLIPLRAAIKQSRL